jgi:class 3 adenylate cyclase/WD40 repeat protein/energy-coupling factor transporter ATP-binding protein EcfA2
MSDGARGARRSAAVRTFLIADIREYSRFTAEFGDEAAARLARRFADVAAEGVEAWGGELVELRGDEALAVFDSARQALRCAVELQDAFADETTADPSLPLNVGIGLDAGEAVPVDDGYRGAALNLAARLCSAAAGGETLASANIVHLTGPVPGLVIGDLVGRTLKGFDQPVDAALVSDAGRVGEAAGAPSSATTPSAVSPEASFPAELEPVVPLVGRVGEMRWLRWHWRRARHGHGRAVVVSGPPGIGKTRLAAELATVIHADEARVRYVPGARGIEAGDLPDATSGPILIVIDDLDAAPASAQEATVDLGRAIARWSALALVVHRQEAAATLRAVVDRLAPNERRLTIGPLGPEEVRAIAALYAGAAAEQAPIRQLMDDSGGVPAAAHRAAAAWARSAATTRLGASASATETGRRELRAAQDALIGDVASLERVSERSRRYDPGSPDATGAPAVTICPYKGLASFEAVDADYYFGRDRLIAEMVAKLVGNPFLGFVGASGSGKSSALRAGLLPSLAAGVLPGSAGWLQVLMRPGESPVAALGQALVRALPDPSASALDAADPLSDAVGRLAPDQGLLLAVDQFEEVFGATRNEAERGAFIDLLTKERRGVRTVVTLRADHYGHCAAYPALARMMSATHVLVGPLTPTELQAVTEAPAERVGLRVEPELVQALVADAGSEPAVLPLLSTALLELWQARHGGWLTLEAYRAGGGLHGAIARLAEAAYAELDPGQSAVARSMFLRLAGPGEGEAVVRRRVALTELDADGDPVAGRVLETLTDARLLTTGDGYVEVAHEALLREWPRLQAWLEEDAEGRKVRLHLIGAARDWDQRGREPADLYRGARLSVALDWATEHQVELYATEREFLEASREATQREVEIERRTNRRLRGLLVGAGVLLVVAVAAGGFALTQADAARQQAALVEQRRVEAEAARTEAETAESFARSRELAASAVAMLDRDPALSKLLALASSSIEDPPLESIAVLHQAWAADRTIYRYTWPDAEQEGGLWADLDRTGELVVAAAGDPPDRHFEVVERSTGEVLWTYPGDGDPPVSVDEPVFSTEGQQVIASVRWDQEGEAPPEDTLGVGILDARTGELVRRIDIGPCGGWVTGVSERRLLVRTAPCLGAEGVEALEVVDLRSGERNGLSADAENETISANGRYVAFDGQQRAIVIDLETGKTILEIDPSTTGEYLNYVRRLSDDGSLLLYGDRPIQVWDVKTGARIAKFSGHAGDTFGYDWSGDTVYSSGTDSTLREWDARTGRQFLIVRAIRGGRPSVSSDGAMVLVANDGAPKAVLLDLRVRGEVGSAPTCPGFIYAGSLHVSRGVAAFHETCATDLESIGVTQVIDLASGKPLYPPLVGVGSQTLDFAPDGTRFVRQEYPDGLTGQIVVKDVRTGNTILPLDGLCTWAGFDDREHYGDCRPFPNTPFPMFARSLRWSPDGSMIAAVDGKNGEEYMAVWDARDGKMIYRGMSDQPVSDVIFSPDSKTIVVSHRAGTMDVLPTDTWQGTSVQGRAGGTGVGPVGFVGFVGFTPDGSTLVSIEGFSGGGGALHWLDATTLKPRRPSVSDAFEGSTKSAAMSPDGSLVAIGASDGLVRVWDILSGRLVHEIPIGDTQVQGVAFVDDKHLAVTPYEGNLLIFTLDRTELLKIVRSSLTRGFTKTECARFNFADACPTLEELRGTAP